MTNPNGWSSSSSYVVYTTGSTTGSSNSSTVGSFALTTPQPGRTELELLNERINSTCLTGRKALGLQ